MSAPLPRKHSTGIVGDRCDNPKSISPSESRSRADIEHSRLTTVHSGASQVRLMTSLHYDANRCPAESMAKTLKETCSSQADVAQRTTEFVFADQRSFIRLIIFADNENSALAL